jgi:hypothetical protein
LASTLSKCIVTIKHDAPTESKKVFKIKDVQIYAGYSLNMERIDSSRSQAQYYKGYYIIDRREKDISPIVC